MANRKKQQPLFANPLVLFLVGVGIALIVAVVAVVILQPGALLKARIPGSSPLAKGACFYGVSSDDPVVVMPVYHECKYVTERDCSGIQDIYVAGLPCPSPFKDVWAEKQVNYRCRETMPNGTRVYDYVVESCKEKLKEGLVKNENSLISREICSGGSLPTTVVEPLLINTILPSPADYDGRCGANCAAIVQCVKPSFSPSKAPSSAPR